MNEMKLDYENYDYIEIIVKKDNAKEVISSYKEFLWQELERKEDARYSDLLHVRFCRTHEIPCKDRLQLLQVYYEFALNERAELNEKKHHKSNAGICNLAVFVTCLLVGLWLLIFYVKNPLFFIGGIVITLAIAIFIVFLSKKLKELRKIEKQRFKIEDEKRLSQIDKIIEEAKTLTSEGGTL